MTTRNNKVSHSEQSDGETDTETSENENMASQNDEVADMRQNGDSASMTSVPSVEEYVRQCEQSKPTLLRRKWVGQLMPETVSDKRSAIANRKRPLDIVPEEKKDLGHTSRDMTTRNNKVSHSEQSDGETDTETSENESMASQNDEVADMRQNGDSASMTSVPSVEEYVRQCEQSKPTLLRRKWVGQLMPETVSDKRSAIANRKRPLDIVPEEKKDLGHTSRDMTTRNNKVSHSEQSDGETDTETSENESMASQNDEVADMRQNGDSASMTSVPSVEEYVRQCEQSKPTLLRRKWVGQLMPETVSDKRSAIANRKRPLDIVPEEKKDLGHTSRDMTTRNNKVSHSEQSDGETDTETSENESMASQNDEVADMRQNGDSASMTSVPSVEEYVRQCEQSKPTLLRRKWVGQLMPETVSDKRSAIANRKRPLDIVPEEKKDLGHTSRDMTTRNNKVSHSEQSDGETDTETSENESMASQNDEVADMRQNGDSASMTRVPSVEDKSLRAQSKPSNLRNLRVGKLMPETVSDKQSAIANRKRPLDIVPEEKIDLGHTPRGKVEELKRKSMRQISETFENIKADDTTPSDVMDELFARCPEQTVLETFHEITQRGKDLNKLDRDTTGNTVLHRAVQKNFLGVAEKFLDYGINPLAYNKLGNIPLKEAIDKKYDEMAAMILRKLRKSVVRRLFSDCKPTVRVPRKATSPGIGCYDEETVKPMYSINTLIESGLDQTIMRVLDSFMEEEQDGLSVVHVKLLDTDDKGREPIDCDFDFKHHTVFQNLAICEKKDTLNHPVIRTIVDYKWRKWCRNRFLYYCCLFLFSLFSLSYSAVTGVTAPDVHTYDSRLQHSRAVFEVISYMYAVATLFTEIRQMIRHKLNYFVQFYNLAEITSAILLVITLPLRYIHTESHWYTFALGYFLWTIRIFKYSLVFTHLGVYAELIKRILAQDFVEFGFLFLVINTIFAGTFLLVLKGDQGLDIHTETSSFQSIMYVGVRTLIEGGPIVEYAGSDGYRTAGTIVMLLFMCFTIVVLLNILIAQISETYTRTRDDCVRTVRANRAWIIARAERNEWNLLPRRPNRVEHYRSKLERIDIKALEKKDASEIEVLSANIAAIKKKQIRDGLEIQTIKTRQRDIKSRLGLKVDKLYDQLEDLKQLLKASGSKKMH